MSKSMNQKFLLVASSIAPIFFLWGCGGQNAQCQSDDDCGGWFKCVGSGTCNPKACTDNAECTGENEICHLSGFCAQQCTQDADCSGKGNFACLKEGSASTGVCTATCAVNEECASDSRELFSCDMAIGKCKPGNYHGSCKDSDSKCESCDPSDVTKCLYCNQGNWEPDMYGVCQPVCKNPANMAGGSTIATDL